MGPQRPQTLRSELFAEHRAGPCTRSRPAGSCLTALGPMDSLPTGQRGAGEAHSAARAQVALADAVVAPTGPAPRRAALALSLEFGRIPSQPLESWKGDNWSSLVASR